MLCTYSTGYRYDFKCRRGSINRNEAIEPSGRDMVQNSMQEEYFFRGVSISRAQLDLTGLIPTVLFQSFLAGSNSLGWEAAALNFYTVDLNATVIENHQREAGVFCQPFWLRIGILKQTVRKNLGQKKQKVLTRSSIHGMRNLNRQLDKTLTDSWTSGILLENLIF